MGQSKKLATPTLSGMKNVPITPLVGLVAAFLYRQVPDWPAVLGMAMIIGGVVVINLFSKTVSH